MTGDRERWALDEDDLGRLECRVKEFLKMFVDEFNERCDSGLYTLKSYILDRMIDDVQ